MGSFIINDNGNGYSRADFVSALEGLQPLLVSGQNIKTINGSSVLGSGNIDVNVAPPTPQEYPQEALLTDTEKQYRANTLARINELNPIVNGKRKYMMFGLISDLHTLPSKSTITAISDADMRADVQTILNAGIGFPNWNGEGNVSDVDNIVSYLKSDWPNSNNPTGYYGTSSEPDIRLLGAIAHAAGFDAVFTCGDLSDGRMAYNCYSYALYYIKKMFDKYITVPHYFTDGNHDRRYDSNVIRRTNTEWLKWLNLMNSNGATYISANDTRYGDKGNTYFIDFPLRKMRAIAMSSYESVDSATSAGWDNSPFNYNVFDALSFENPQDAEEWSVFAFSHYNSLNQPEYLFPYYMSGERIGSNAGVPWGATTRNVAGFMNPDKSTTNSTPGPYNSQSKNAQYGRGYKGKAAICCFSGHVHSVDDGFSVTQENGKNLVNRITIADSQSSGYIFSIIIIDDDEFKVHWLRYGTDIGGTIPSGFDRTAHEFTLDYRHH